MVPLSIMNHDFYYIYSFFMPMSVERKIPMKRKEPSNDPARARPNVTFEAKIALNSSVVHDATLFSPAVARPSLRWTCNHCSKVYLCE